MFKLITVRLLAWVIVAIIAVAATTTFVYYHKGLRVGEDKLKLYKLTVKAVGEAQALQSKKVIAEQKTIAMEANNEANNLRAALDKHYADQRLRDQQARKSAGSRGVPTISCASEGTESAAQESELNTLRVKAANDALTILFLQKWAHDTAAAYNGSLR